MKNDAWSLLVACSLPTFLMNKLADTFILLTYDPTQPIGPQTMNADALLITIDSSIDSQTVEALSNRVKAVATYSVGFEHIDHQALAARGIALLHTPDVLSPSVAETAVLLALGAMRRATESIDLIRSGQWIGWTPSQLIGTELTGKIAGIFGMGRIGRAIASRLRGMGMCIAYHNRSQLALTCEQGATYCQTPEQLLNISDLLVLACPSSSETQHFLNADRISHLKYGAFVVNISRGNVVDDEALIEALAKGKVSAAGLDVFDNEPHLDSRYYELSNVFMLPHIGSSTVEARTKMMDTLINGLLSLRCQKMPSNLV
jgi:glyoxylate reductase